MAKLQRDLLSHVAPGVLIVIQDEAYVLNSNIDAMLHHSCHAGGTELREHVIKATLASSTTRAPAMGHVP